MLTTRVANKTCDLMIRCMQKLVCSLSGFNLIQTVTFERLWPDHSSCFLCKPQQHRQPFLVMLDDLINAMSPAALYLENICCGKSFPYVSVRLYKYATFKGGLAKYALKYGQPCY